MGQKMNPNAMRLGIGKTWKSMWYADDKNYKDKLHEDIKIREYVTQKLKMAGLDRVEIARSTNNIQVNAYVARPGVAIGRGGEGIDEIKKYLSRKIKSNIDIKINEVRKPELSARIIANSVAEGMQRGQSPKKMMSIEKDKAIQAGAKGVRIWVSGDFGVPKQSRTMKLTEGNIPLQTLRSNIDFATVAVPIRNEGLRGVRVWVYREDQEEDNKSESVE
ncbi:30S ribosomal protein S3 [Candidatus Dojkabacteria bacterium]|nr:30S ribosomal protein S3 [Candidatus Dojkabacteria bacterium]